MTEAKIVYIGRGNFSQEISLEAYILAVIRKYEPIDRDMIRQKTGIPRTTIYDAIVKLKLDGYVRTFSNLSKKCGRPRVLYRYIPPIVRLVAKLCSILSPKKKMGDLIGSEDALLERESSGEVDVPLSPEKRKRKRKQKVPKIPMEEKQEDLREEDEILKSRKRKNRRTSNSEWENNRLKNEKGRKRQDSLSSGDEDAEITEEEIDGFITHVTRINRVGEESIENEREEIIAGTTEIKKRKYENTKSIGFTESKSQTEIPEPTKMLLVCRGCLRLFRAEKKVLCKPFTHRLCPKCF